MAGAMSEDLTDEQRDEMSALEQQIATLLQRHAEVRYGVDHPNPLVIGWAAGYEVTSIDLEQQNAGVRGVVVPDGQAISFSLGLGVLVQKAFEPDVH